MYHSANAEELEGNVLCSVPSAVQSHKPPLVEVIADACGIRDHPYMTSAKISGFWTPSPLVRIWD